MVSWNIWRKLYTGNAFNWIAIGQLSFILILSVAWWQYIIQDTDQLYSVLQLSSIRTHYLKDTPHCAELGSSGMSSHPWKDGEFTVTMNGKGEDMKETTGCRIMENGTCDDNFKVGYFVFSNFDYFTWCHCFLNLFKIFLKVIIYSWADRQI